MTISPNEAYRMSFDHALRVIERNGGKFDDDSVTIRCQTPKAMPLE